jgi:hypothetical protein
MPFLNETESMENNFPIEILNLPIVSYEENLKNNTSNMGINNSTTKIINSTVFNSQDSKNCEIHFSTPSFQFNQSHHNHTKINCSNNYSQKLINENIQIKPITINNQTNYKPALNSFKSVVKPVQKCLKNKFQNKHNLNLNIGPNSNSNNINNNCTLNENQTNLNNINTITSRAIYNSNIKQTNSSQTR